MLGAYNAFGLVVHEPQHLDRRTNPCAWSGCILVVQMRLKSDVLVPDARSLSIGTGRRTVGWR